MLNQYTYLMKVKCLKHINVPLLGDTSSGLVLDDTDGVTVTAKRACGATCVPVAVTVA